MLYAYDQPQRLRAIDKALTRARVLINSNTKILDIGCGMGDVIELLLKHGEPEITGVDLSDETISYTRKKFATNKKIRLLAVGVEDMDFPVNSFDLVIGVNILQHVTDMPGFAKAIQNMMRVTEAGGHILVMDFSPIKVENRKPGPYVIIRSRQEYIAAFEQGGCRFMSEFGLPRLGVRLYRTTERILARLAKEMSNSKPGVIKETMLVRESAQPLKLRIWHLIGVVLLTLARPFDHLLVPFPVAYTDMRILIFEKASR